MGSLSLLQQLFPNQESNWGLLIAGGFFTNWTIREAQWSLTGINQFWSILHPSPTLSSGKTFPHHIRTSLRRGAWAELHSHAASFLALPTVLSCRSLVQPHPEVTLGPAAPYPRTSTPAVPTCHLPPSLPLLRSAGMCEEPQHGLPAWQGIHRKHSYFWADFYPALHPGPTYQPLLFWEPRSLILAAAVCSHIKALLH